MQECWSGSLANSISLNRKMADLGFGGRVLAGEDSEEDEEEEELDFQFGSNAASTSTGPRPKFIIQALTPPKGGEESDEDDDDGDGDDDHGEKTITSTAEEEAPARRDLRISISSSSRSLSRPNTPERTPLQQDASSSKVTDESHWSHDKSVDGVAVMSRSIADKLQPNLDRAIRRIAELTDNQQRLLVALSSQHKAICSNDEMENVAIVMGKLPQYIKKVQDIKASMAAINSSIDRLKKRSESLRVDAQSYAIKKESKRESMNQWNKLYVAKSYEGVTVSTTISSSVVHQPPQ